MSQETLKMSRKERERLIVMTRYQKGEMLLKEAAWEMRVSVRQAIRINKRYEQHGAEGLTHRSRDMPSHRAHDPEFRQRVLELYQENYRDFGPTLAAEKMAEREGVEVNHETLRRWLMDEALWRVGEKERVHRSKRKRRERYGELLQIDGSDHEWFEDRGPRSMMMVLVDDATSNMMLHMAKSETTEAALVLLKKWVAEHGVPAALYADRRTVYFTEEFVQEPDRRDDPQTFTKFMRVADRLNIKMIPAYSPQAKGRVERANGLLQDRLVKEFRLRGISTIEDANAMLDAFAEDMNRRFSREPARAADAHRAAPKGRRQWEYFFCYEEFRKVQRDNTVMFKNEQYQILKQKDGPMPGHRVTLRTPVGGGGSYWLFGERRLKVSRLGFARPRAPSNGGQPPDPRDLAH